MQESPLNVLGHYRIDRRVGQGGMGCVYLATDEQLHRTVALKVLRTDFAVDEEARARFFREARAAAGLKHDNIVTIYQVGEDRGTPFLAMEYLEGKSLEEWLRPDRRASFAQTFSIGKQIARGLASAHKAGVVHRDIKPANIWLESNGRIKILDFGLAFHTSENITKLTQAGVLLGTPAYMSPEQARGEPVDERSDLFSFGCVLYRMVTGRLPFQAEGIFGVIAAVTSEQQISPRSINPTVPHSLSDLIDELLQKSREARPASAENILTALKEIERNGRESSQPNSATSDETVSVSQPSEKLSPRGKSPQTRSAIFLAMLIAISGMGLWFAFKSDHEVKDVKARPEDVSSQTTDQTDPTNESSSAEEAKPEDDQNRIELLPLVDLDQFSPGIWRREGEALIGHQPRKSDKVFGFAIPVPDALPETYCLRMRVERNSMQPGALIVGLASGESRFVVFIDAEPPNKPPGLYIGIHVDTFTRTGKVLIPNVPVELEFWVLEDQLKVTADNQVVYSWKGDLSQLDRPPGMPNVPLVIGGTYPATFKFTQVTLGPVSPEVANENH